MLREGLQAHALIGRADWRRTPELPTGHVIDYVTMLHGVGYYAVCGARVHPGVHDDGARARRTSAFTTFRKKLMWTLSPRGAGIRSEGACDACCESQRRHVRRSRVFRRVVYRTAYRPSIAAHRSWDGLFRATGTPARRSSVSRSTQRRTGETARHGTAAFRSRNGRHRDRSERQRPSPCGRPRRSAGLKIHRRLQAGV